MDDLDLYRRIEYPNETRLSWAVEGERDGLFPIVGSLLRRPTAGDPERPAD